MKTKFVLNIFREELSPEVFQSLARVYPEGIRKSPSCFNCALNWNDSRKDQLLKILESNGYRAWSGAGMRKANELTIITARQYEETDLATAKLLRLFEHPDQDLFAADYGGDGVLKIDGQAASAGFDLVWNFTETLVVSQITRKRFMASGLTKMVFRPTHVLWEGRTAGPGHYWEMTSDFVLPPLSPLCKLVTNNDEPFTGDPQRGCMLVEGQYRPPEFHYNSTVLPPLEEFDMALANEFLGPSPGRVFRPLVVSQRFYQFCKEQDFKLSWIPVRIDPD